MALQTYSDLQSAVADYGLWPSAPITMLIAKAETNLRPLLKHRLMETTVTQTVTAGTYMPLPTDFQEMRTLYVNDLEAKPIAFTDRRHSWNHQPGFVVSGNNLVIRPAPTADYTVEMTYYAKLPALSDSNPTNWLMTNFPSVYLHAVLAEVYHWAKDPDNEKSEQNVVQAALTLVKEDHVRSTAYGNTLIEELPRW